MAGEGVVSSFRSPDGWRVVRPSQSLLQFLAREGV